MKKHGKNKKIYMILVISMVLFSQLADSFCAEIYSKMQSFILDDYIIRGTGLDMNEAVSKLGYMMLPFYIVPALSPLARVFVDKYGKNRVMSANFILLIAGCVICAISGNIIAFLIGNAIITFAVSVDIQNMYVARELPKEKRATVRGIMSGVSAGAAMLIPLLRKYLVERGAGWKGIYVAAVPVCVFVLIIVRMVGGSADTYEKDAEPAGKTVSYQKNIRKYMIMLFCIGMATSGVTLYNEPILVNSGYTEQMISEILLIEPVALLIFNLFFGWLADKIKREQAAGIDIFLTMIFLVIFVAAGKNMCNGVIMGIAWGGMTGCYFSAVNILLLLILENCDGDKVGKMSAVSAYINGAGNAAGIVLCTILVKKAGMETVKLVLAMPALVVTLLLLIRKKKVNQTES